MNLFFKFINFFKKFQMNQIIDFFVNIFISNTNFSIDFDFNTFVIEKYSSNIYID